MAHRAAEQREKVEARPVHQLGDGHLCGKGPPHLQAESFPCGGPGQIVGQDPCDFDDLATIKGSKVLPDLTDVNVVIQEPHPGVKLVGPSRSTLRQVTSHSPRVRVACPSSGTLGMLCSHITTKRAQPFPRARVSPSRMYLPSGERCRTWETLQGLTKTLAPDTARRRKDA